jgi:hypothetical protein
MLLSVMRVVGAAIASVRSRRLQRIFDPLRIDLLGTLRQAVWRSCLPDFIEVFVPIGGGSRVDAGSAACR